MDMNEGIAVDSPVRCAWAGAPGGAMAAYHDAEWGVPVHDDRRLFEMLILEGAQAGLSWSTILRKREAYRKAFDGFDPGRVARYGEEKFAGLLADAGIVRNRLKVRAAAKNARVFLEIQAEAGSFDAYLWGFAGGRQLDPGFATLADIPTRDGLSDAIAKDLKKRGMGFVGTTIIYAYLQAVGVINAHVRDCFRHGACARGDGR